MPDPIESSTLAAEALEIAHALLRDALGGRPPFPPSIEAVARALDDFRAAGVAAERERKAIIADEYARNAAEAAQMYTEENMQAVATQLDEEGRRFVRERP